MLTDTAGIIIHKLIVSIHHSSTRTTTSLLMWIHALVMNVVAPAASVVNYKMSKATGMVMYFQLLFFHYLFTPIVICFDVLEES